MGQSICQAQDSTGTEINDTTLHALKVSVIASSGSGTPTVVDEAAWTAGSSTFSPNGGVFNDSAAALTTGQQGTHRVTPNRADHVNLRNNSGTEIGTLANAVRVDPVGTTAQPVSGTVTANQGTANATPWNTNVAQVGGSTIAIGQAAMAASMPVVIASNQTSVPVTLVATTTGGGTPFHYIAAAAANQDSQNVKGSAGTLLVVAGFCTQAAIRYLKVYDKATAPTSADTPILTLLMPGNAAGAGFTLPLGAFGVALANGLGTRLTTGLADNDTGTVTANDCVIDLVYK